MTTSINMEPILNFHCPRYKELSDMGLYLEQMLGVVNDKLSPLGMEPITGAMVSNYIKNKAIPSPVKKKYHRDHLCHIFAVCILKQVFSVQQIADFFEIQGKTYPLETAYNYFCAEFENALKEAFLFTGQALPIIETKRTPETVLVRAVVLSVSNRIYADSALKSITDTKNGQPAASKK